MALPIQIGDVFSCTGRLVVSTSPMQVFRVADRIEGTVGVLIRAYPLNANTVFIGSEGNVEFPLQPGESVHVRVSKRSAIYVRGTPPDAVVALTVLTSGLQGDRCRSAY